MGKRAFKVTVDGYTYHVIVEEAEEEKPAPDTTPSTKGTAKTESNEAPPKVAPVDKTKQESAPAEEAPGDTPPSSAPPAQGKKGAEPSKGGTTVAAPMPGSIIDVKISEGDQVNEGDLLLILEAMKMENEITAPVSGTVVQVLAQKGTTVNSGDRLVVIE